LSKAGLSSALNIIGSLRFFHRLVGWLACCWLCAGILQQVSPVTKLTMLRKVSWVLSLLCGVTHPAHQLPLWELVRFTAADSLFGFSRDDDGALVR
jgi:hypothetical protein